MNTTPNENENIQTNEPEESVNNESITEVVEVEENIISEELLEETVDTSEEETAECSEDEKSDTNETAEENATEPEVDASTKKTLNKKLKLSGFAGLIALIAVCAILWVSYTGFVSNGKYPENYDSSKTSAVFIKGSDVMVHKANGEVYTLVKNTDENTTNGYSASVIFSQTALRSPDGTAVFFYENFKPNEYTGDLYVTYKNGKKILIDQNASTGLLSSADGKVLAYAKFDPEEKNANKISLHLYRKGKEPVKITDNYSPSINPMLSYNSNYLAYSSMNNETGSAELYIVKISAFGVSEPKKVADNITKLYSINNNGYAFYAKASESENSLTGSALYYASYSKAEVLVGEDAVLREDCVAFSSNRYAYYTRSTDGNVKFYSAKVGGEPKLIFENSDFYLSPDVQNNNYIFITVNPEDSSLLDIQRVNGTKLKTVATDTSASGLNNVLNSQNYNKITYTRNFDELTYSGEFFISKTFLGMSKEYKISDNVNLAIRTPTLKYIAYFTDTDMYTGVGTLHLYDGKKSTKVAENVPCYSVSFSSDEKKLFYLTDSSDDFATATLCMINTSNPGKTHVVDTEVSTINMYEFMYAPRTNGNLYYFKNYDPMTGVGDLYFAKKGKNPTKVESGVSSLVLE